MNIDFEHFLLKILPPQKIVPCKTCFNFNKSAVFSTDVVLFRFTVTIIDNFDINSSARNDIPKRSHPLSTLSNIHFNTSYSF